MIVIGTDTHKRTHALAAVDADTGQVLGEREMEAEGKSRIEAMHCLKRHLARRYHRLLLAADTQEMLTTARGASR